MSGTASPPTISFSYSLSIEIETSAPDVAAILLNGSATGPVSATLPEANAAYPVASVEVVTHSGNPWSVPLELGGPDGHLFALTHSGVAPCDLAVGDDDIDAGEYSIKISAPPA